MKSKFTDWAKKKTGDGSETLWSGIFDESYHSAFGAITEAEHVFIREGLALIKKNEINLFEVGFGTGLNAFLAFEFALNNKIRLNYIGLEPFPLDKEKLFNLNFNLGKEREELHKDFLGNLFHSPERMLPEFGMNFFISERALEQFESPKSHFDIAFFDAFAKSKQPEIWDFEMIKKVGEMLRDEGFFVTYAATGQLRRDLKSLGFLVENPSGPPNGKRQMTRGIKARF